jgi:hypothetical protein
MGEHGVRVNPDLEQAIGLVSSGVRFLDWPALLGRVRRSQRAAIADYYP